MSVNKKTANITGYLYLSIILGSVFGGMLTGMALSSSSAGMPIAGYSDLIYGLGFSIYEITYMVELGTALLLYVLLKPANLHLALLAAFFRVAEAIMLAFNMQNQFQAYTFLAGHPLLAIPGEQVQQYAAMLLEMHRSGYLISQLFFGVHCFLIGTLIIKSGYFPKWIGGFLIAACFGYLMESFAYFLMPENQSISNIFSIISAVPAVLTEFSLTYWLIFKGKDIESRFRERNIIATGELL